MRDVDMVARLGGAGSFYKIGLQLLFTREGVAFAERLAQSQRVFMDVAEIWGTSRLTRFDVATGAVEELAPNVAAGQVWHVFGHEFLFQNPKDPRTEAYITGRIG